MEIRIVSAGRSFNAQLHFAVYDETEFMVAASYAGLETGTRAITAALIEGRAFTVRVDSEKTVYLKALAGGYRRVDKVANGPIIHSLVLSKSAIFEENNDLPPVVIAFDGDIKTAIGKFMAARFTLPKEWVDRYIDLIPKEGIENLKVLVNPLNKKGADIKAVRLSANYMNDKYILKEIDNQLKNGKLVIPPADPNMPQGQFLPGWTMRDYMKQNAHVLAAQLANVRPHHVPGIDPLNPAIAELGRIPFPAQAHMIQGLYNALQCSDSVKLDSDFCGADMGCGKSIMSLGVAYLLYKEKLRKGGKGFSVLLCAPGITVPKWKKNEIAPTIPGAKIRILTSTEDAARYAWEVKNGYVPEGMEFVLVGLDRVKLGPEPWPTAIWKRVAGTRFKAWHCPDCSEPLIDPEAEQPDTLAFWNTLAHGDPPEIAGGFFEAHNLPKFGQKPVLKRTSNNFPVGFKVQWNRLSKLKVCQNCNSKLSRPALKSRDETKMKPRYFISQILKGMRKHFDLFIYDEIQKASAEDSGRGDAFAQMVKSAKKMLFLTGTLVNGKSTSIKEVLWRTDPGALLKEGFKHDSGKVAWAARYGVLKKITRVIEEDTGYVTRRKRVQMQPVEEPGIAPQMVAQFLLHKVAFMELGNLGLPLVNLIERPIFVDLDPDHQVAYNRFHENLHSVCKQAIRNGSKGAFSKFNPATICYGDRPDRGAAVQVGKHVVTAPELGYYHAKERELVKLVQQELSEDRGVIIGLNYTDSYQCHIRIKDVLAAHGIEAHVLTSSVPSEKRVDWLAKKEAEGAKVLITNIKLVEVGLDLIPWQTLVLYQLTEEVNVVRQFARRNWRIGAYRECRVFYMIYNGTTQMVQFLRIMRKRGHAMMAEGRLIDRSELSEYCLDGQNNMAADVASCLADAKVAEKWTELARKDIDSNVRLVDEKDYKAVLDKAMRELVEETKRLCGVTDSDSKQQIIPQDTAEPSIDDMWEKIIDDIAAKSKKKKVLIPNNQLSLFSFGMGA